MILLGMWGRNFDANGNMTAFPAGAWKWYAENLDQVGDAIDGLQAPPASLTASGSAANGDGYGVFCYRNLDGTYWGMKVDLVALAKKLHARGKKLAGDAPFRQMDGENGGPGVFTYKDFAGSTTPSWFQCFNQPGEEMAPAGTPAAELTKYFVAQDDIPSTDGDEPDGRVRSFQHCIPAGVVEADTIAIFDEWVAEIGYDIMRMDEGKAIHIQSMARVVKSQPKVFCYAEVMYGDAQDLYNYAVSEPMNSCAAVEDYEWYWHLQQACNSFKASLLKQSGTWGFFQWRSDLAVLFFGNPDVTPSRGEDGGISEQIVFNLASAAALTLCLPGRMAIIDAQAYWGSSATFPQCYGLKLLPDNIAWFAKTFAIGAWAELWLDDDVAAYSRNGDGGEFGWSGGCVIGVNFNTWDERTVTLSTPMWEPGCWVHDYSVKGGCVYRDFTVSANRTLTATFKANAFSAGTAFALLAPGGVS